MFDLGSRRLYLCVGVRDDLEQFLPAVLRGGVDVVQLREKTLDLDAQLRAARIMQPICRAFDVPFIVNDSPELAVDAEADGVHVGQDDTSVERCRQILGEEAIVGLSTHSPDEFNDALSHPADLLQRRTHRGDAHQTGPRRNRTRLRALRASDEATVPVFVTGGVSEHNVAALVAAGLRHFVVVRALTESPDPEATARAIRRALDVALAMAVEPT